MIRRAIALFALLGATNVGASDFDYCLVCHGADGNGNAAIRAPKIAGLESWYVRRQLEAFATGRRGSTADDMPGQEMRPIGERLRQEGSMDAAVKFAGSLRPAPLTPTVKGDATSGRRHYVACATCHGATGEGNPQMQAPRLAGQNDWYLVAQLQNYRHGRRGFAADDAAGAMMRAAATLLPDDKAVADVVSHINSLVPGKGASE